MVLPPSSDLTSLDARAREIFREIVESYLTTGEPVGSRTLSKLAGGSTYVRPRRTTAVQSADTISQARARDFDW